MSSYPTSPPARATRRHFLAGLGLVGAAGLAACARPAAAPAPTLAPTGGAAPAAPPSPITFAVTSRHAGNWPAYVSLRKGFWQAEGLEPELISSATTVVAVQTAVSSSTEITMITADSAIAAVEKGADLICVFGVQNSPVYSLVVQPEITSYEQLRGKNIGVSALSSGDAFFVQKMLDGAGLRLDQDYSIVPSGGTPERYAALKNGAIAGGLLIQQFDTRIVKEGYRRLALSTDAVRDYSWTAYWVARAWARANEEVLVRALRALRAGHQWLHDPANRDEAVALLIDELSAEPDDVQASYTLLVEQARAFSRQGEIPDAAMQAPIDFLAARGDLTAPLPPVSKFIDLTYLRKAGADV